MRTWFAAWFVSMDVNLLFTNFTNSCYKLLKKEKGCRLRWKGLFMNISRALKLISISCSYLSCNKQKSLPGLVFVAFNMLVLLRNRKIGKVLITWYLNNDLISVQLIIGE